MATINVGELRACLLGKLRASEDRAKHHVRLEIFDAQGNLVARTRLSHSWRDSTSLSAQMASSIKRELKLSAAKDLDDLISCELSRNQYLDLART
jgi:hypothetical protein